MCEWLGAVVLSRPGKAVGRVQTIGYRWYTLVRSDEALHAYLYSICRTWALGMIKYVTSISVFMSAVMGHKLPKTSHL